MTRILMFWLLALMTCCVVHGKAMAAGEVQGDGIEKLTGQLQSDDAFVRLKAVRALGAMGPAAAPALPALEKLLKDPDEDVRAVVTTAVQKIKAAGTGGADIEKLVSQLGDQDAMIRLKAAKTLGEKGAAAQKVAAALEKLLKDPDEDVRLVARGALKKIGAEPAGPATGAPPAAAAKAADVEVVRTVSLFCNAHSDAAGLTKTPSQRFVMAVLKNNGTTALKVSAMKLSWLDNGGKKEIESEDLPAIPEILVPGAEMATWFYVPCVNENRKWRLAIEQVTPAKLSEDEATELQQNEQMRRKLKVVLVKTLKDPTVGFAAGESFTVRNLDANVARNVRVLLCGYDEDRKLVRVHIYHMPKAGEGDTTVEWNVWDLAKMERAQKMATQEVEADAERLVNVAKFQGEVLDVGAEKKSE